ncbi:conserved hypothetical protein, partial [Ricinus communis]
MLIVKRGHRVTPIIGATEVRMKVLVAVKRVVDYNVSVRVKSDNTGVDIAA